MLDRFSTKRTSGKTFLIPMRRHVAKGEGYNPAAVARHTAESNRVARSKKLANSNK